MKGFRNPRYAPEFLDRKLRPMEFSREIDFPAPITAVSPSDPPAPPRLVNPDLIGLARPVREASKTLATSSLS